MQPWKIPKTFFWEEAPFFRLMIPLIAAIICYEYQWLPDLQGKSLILLLSGNLLLLLFSSLRRNSQLISFLNGLLIFSALFFTGWIFCFLNNIKNNPAWFGNKLRSAEAFEVKVTETPQEKERTWKLNVAVTKCITPDSAIPATGNALIYIYKSGYKADLRQGDIVLVPAKWTAIKNSGNPFEFDYESFCRRNNLYYQQFLPASEVIPVKKAAVEPSFIDRTHDWAMRALEYYFPSDQATLGLLQAMLLGDDINFDPELRQRYSDTGIVHMVAISGSHVMIFFQFIALFFFWLRSKRYQPVKYMIAIPLVCFYVAVAGAPASAVRAAIMFAFLGIGLMIQKDRQPLNQLFATAFFMLLYEPSWLFAIGFQLSFAAVLSLMLFFQPIYKLYRPKNVLLKTVWQSMAASLAAEILIAPLVVFYFHLFPAGFIVSNVFAYLFMSVVLMSGMVLIIFSSVSWIAWPLAYLISGIVFVFNHIMLWMQRVNPESFRHLLLSFSGIILLYISIAGFAFYLLKKQSRSLMTGLSALVLFFALEISGRIKTFRQERLIVYNVNRAALADLISGNHFIPFIVDSSLDERQIAFAAKEFRVRQKAWKGKNPDLPEIVRIGQKHLLMLQAPVPAESAGVIPVDYLLINYPVKQFNAPELKQMFQFEKLIVTGSQKRYLLQQWQDSCARYGIAAHFTMFDGAFVMEQ